MRTSLIQLPAYVDDLTSARWITEDGDRTAGFTAEFGWITLSLAVTACVVATAVAIATMRAWRRERLRASELSIEELRYRNLFEKARDLLFTLTPDGRVASINQAIERITGRPRDEFLGKPFADLAANPEERKLLVEHLQKVVQHRSSGTTQIGIQGRQGKRFVELSSHGLPETGAVEVIQGMARDVTMRKQLEQGKLRSEQLEAVGRLSGRIAHDYNNILTIIRGHAERIREDLRPAHESHSEDDARHGLDAILAATRGAELLTLQLLGHSRRSAQESELLDVHEVIADTMQRLALMLPEDIDCRMTLSADPPHVFADRGTIEQILLNLVLNARDAMPEGGELQVETHRQNLIENTVIDGVMIKAGDWIVLSVADDGIGMDEATTAQVFEPFFTTKNPGHGSGLGLATVQSAMIRMGGHVMVASHPRSGARFTLYLPWSDLIPAAPPVERESSAGSEHVLLVDDEEQVREVFRRALEAAGYQVTEAVSAERTLELGAETLASIDAIVTDSSLTGTNGMTGTELTRRLRADHPDLPAILVSGMPPEHIDEGVRFLKKPIAPSLLLAELRTLLDGRTQVPTDQPPA